jgi:molybdopterin molybdotransferase
LHRITLDEAIERAITCAPRLATEIVSLDALVGRVLAEDLVFHADLPPFDQAAMEGYAIAGGAAAGASFRVVGESRAGAPANEVDTTSAMTISTGAAVARGLDTIIPWEDVEKHTNELGEHVTLRREARTGQHLRRRGDDARAGSSALAGGTLLSARHVALLATLERSSAEVHRRAKVAIVCTGDELRDPGGATRPGAIVDSNGPMLTALVAQGGGTASCVRARDTREAAHEAIDRASREADLVITVGGAADGKHDHVLPVLDALGARSIFRGVAIKPGKPVALATRTRPDDEREVPVLALPGNPGSAFVTFTLFGLPLLRAMHGERAPSRVRPRVRSASTLRCMGDRDVLAYGALEVRDGEPVFVPAPAATSGSIPGLASAAALAIVRTGVPIDAGGLVEVVDVERA